MIGDTVVPEEWRDLCLRCGAKEAHHLQMLQEEG